MTRRIHESWFHKNWRLVATAVYLIVVSFDFLLAPIMLGWYSIYTHSTLQMWTPITTSGGGIFHISLGAIIGLYAHGKNQEAMKPVGDMPHDPITDDNSHTKKDGR